MTELIILLIVVVTALAFDFTNGFHDTGNAMATSIATGALRPKVAVTLSAVLNLVGAFLSVEVATTVAKGVVDLDQFNLADPGQAHQLLLVVFAGLIGGIVWNLLTWLLGIPSSSSHALVGGLIGAAVASLGMQGVAWNGVLAKVVVPALCAPVVAGLVATVGTSLVYRFTRPVAENDKNRYFRWGQIGSASLVSLAHGTNDAQKTMGVIFLALVATGSLGADADIPFWVKFSCAIAIALGTYMGGWRVIRTLGKGLVEIDSPQGMAAETSSAAIILTSSHFGMALSTTHVATGSIMGSGLGRKGAEVRWSVAGRMAVAWMITLPAAALVGGLTWLLAHTVGLATDDLVGVILAFAILVALAGLIFARSRRAPVNSGNVNADWDATTNRVAPPVAIIPDREDPLSPADTVGTRSIDSAERNVR
ncbi:inorganic phosphate transporter [Corynebacterium meridianum]|uniref:Phosphate transporter n=1 Tax=Corynebacterium meridianum TaxID=2765363 RepID=A0A934I670_9CORY|nr:inorganic phosphate transporter [Corynebacterium meridianum]MCK7677584.1 inorganic phosphate transporter [Corynebacterium meridianum]